MYFNAILQMVEGHGLIQEYQDFFLLISALSKKGLEKTKNIQQCGCPFHAPHPQLDSIEKMLTFRAKNLRVNKCVLD